MVDQMAPASQMQVSLFPTFSKSPPVAIEDDDQIDLLIGESESEDEESTLRELQPMNQLVELTSPSAAPTPTGLIAPVSQDVAASKQTEHSMTGLASALPLPAIGEQDGEVRHRKRRWGMSPTLMVSEARMIRVRSIAEIMANLNPSVIDILERATDIGIPKQQTTPKVMNIWHVVSL